MRISSLKTRERQAGVLIHGIFNVREALEYFASGELQRKLIPGIIEKVPKRHRTKPKTLGDFSNSAVRRKMNAHTYTRCQKVLKECDKAEDMQDFVDQLIAAIVEYLKGKNRCFSREFDFNFSQIDKVESLSFAREMRKENPAPAAKSIAVAHRWKDIFLDLADELNFKSELLAFHPGRGSFYYSTISVTKIGFDTYLLQCSYPFARDEFVRGIAERMGVKIAFENFVLELKLPLTRKVVEVDFRVLTALIEEAFGASLDPLKVATEFSAKEGTLIKTPVCRIGISGYFEDPIYHRKDAKVMVGHQETDPKRRKRESVFPGLRLFLTPLKSPHHFTLQEEECVRASLGKLKELLEARLVSHTKSPRIKAL